MGKKSFIVPLGDSDKDRYRLDCTITRGHVIIFRVQYEAFIDGEWRPIVRYDTAHGYPHRDLLHPDRPEEKTMWPGRSSTEALTIGQEDIKRNWVAYRARYQQEMGQ